MKLTFHLRHKGITSLLSLLIWLCAGQLRAQSDEGQLRISVQLNPTFSWISSTSPEVDPSGGLLGFQTGLFGEYGITDRISLIGGLRLNVNYGGTLNYAKEGTFWPTAELTDESFRVIPANSDVIYRTQFVEIPIGLIYYTGPLGAGSGTRAYIESPSFSLLLSSRARGVAASVNSGAQNILDDIRFLNFGLGFGAGIIPDWIDGADVRIGLGYQTMFTDLINDGMFTDGQQEDSKAKLGVLSFKFTILL